MSDKNRIRVSLMILAGFCFLAVGSVDDDQATKSNDAVKASQEDTQVKELQAKEERASKLARAKANEKINVSEIIKMSQMQEKIRTIIHNNNQEAIGPVAVEITGYKHQWLNSDHTKIKIEGTSNAGAYIPSTKETRQSKVDWAFEATKNEKGWQFNDTIQLPR
jgi:hypothetical protein